MRDRCHWPGARSQVARRILGESARSVFRTSGRLEGSDDRRILEEQILPQLLSMEPKEISKAMHTAMLTVATQLANETKNSSKTDNKEPLRVTDDSMAIKLTLNGPAGLPVMLEDVRVNLEDMTAKAQAMGKQAEAVSKKAGIVTNARRKENRARKQDARIEAEPESDSHEDQCIDLIVEPTLEGGR